MKRFFLLLLIIGLSACGEKGTYYGPYSIGRDPSWFPLQLGNSTDKLTAFSTALVQEITKTEQIPIHLLNIDWVEICSALEKGEVTGIFSSLPPNIISQAKYSFSQPIILLGPVLIVPITSDAQNLTALEGKVVGVYQFDESVLAVQPYPSIVIELYQNKPTALEDLASGKYDALLMPLLDAQTLISNTYAESLKIVSPPLNNKAIRLITLKDKNSSLIKYFNRGLEKSLYSGKYQELLMTYQLN